MKITLMTHDCRVAHNVYYVKSLAVHFFFGLTRNQLA